MARGLEHVSSRNTVAILSEWCLLFMCFVLVSRKLHVARMNCGRPIESWLLWFHLICSVNRALRSLSAPLTSRLMTFVDRFGFVLCQLGPHRCVGLCSRWTFSSQCRKASRHFARQKASALKRERLVCVSPTYNDIRPSLRTILGLCVC